jgi:hypothetical protein
VELWREDAGTAAICGFGLPPDEALAADQSISTRAMDLKAAGVPGTMDQLRVRAYLDALLGQDTRQSLEQQPPTSSPVPPDTGPPAGEDDRSSGTAPAGSGQHDRGSGTTPASPGQDDRSGTTPASQPPARPTGPTGSPGPRPPGTGPPGGYGTWRLQPVPGGPDLTVDLEPIPVTDCDHRHETGAHDPSDKLRHLVQIRDGECTWPPCRRAAERCDFEHALPWEQGGKTCACNAGPPRLR